MTGTLATLLKKRIRHESGHRASLSDCVLAGMVPAELWMVRGKNHGVCTNSGIVP